MSGPILSANYRGSLKPGLEEYFSFFHNKWIPIHTQIYEKRKGKHQYERYSNRTRFGLMQAHGEQQLITLDDSRQFQTQEIRPDAYALAFEVSKFAIDDNVAFDIIKQSMRDLAISYEHTMEETAHDPFNDAFDASLYSAIDGLALCSTAHLTDGAGTFSNRLSTSAPASYDSVVQMIIEMRQMVDESGLPVLVKDAKCLAPIALESTLCEIIKSKGRAGVMDNNENALMHLGYMQNEMCISPYLTSDTAFFILTDAPDGRICLERQALEFDQDKNIYNGTQGFVATARWKHFVNEIRSVFGNSGTAA